MPSVGSSKTASSKKVGRLVASRRKELAVLDDEFFAEVVGVAQAINALRAALKQVSAALDARQFEKASALGYEQVASEFIFLQRTLGGLQGACLHKEKLVQDLAVVLRRPYEDVLPEVDAVMESARPIDRKQRIANRKKAAPQLRAAIEALTRNFSGDAGAEKAPVRRRRGRRA
jgi:hypothetical protein